MTDAAGHSKRPFVFDRDTFAYRHELAWEYQFDAVTGAMTVRKTQPPPRYYHRCFMMVRAVRLFWDHARFAPELPPAAEPILRGRVRAVIARSPRTVCAESERVVIPGFDGLRSLSQTHEALLKEECGAAWQSYFLRSHWRMIFRVSGGFQERMAEKLYCSLNERGLALVHLFRFPRITINHGIVLFDAKDTGTAVEFQAADPNIPAHPVQLIYDKQRRVFTFAPNIYWGGGAVSVMEIYRGFPY